MKLLIEKSEKNKQLVFNAIKAQILKHLEKLEVEETANLKKAFSQMLAKGGKGYPVGTIREWKGKKFIKTAPGKWRPKYDGETRGAKLSVANLKKKINACNTAQEMMQIMLENRDRFSDENGNPLPFVQDLSKFISQTQDEKFGAKIKEENTTKKKKTRSGGGDDGNGGDEPPDNSYPEKNYPEYKGKGQEAVDFIVKQKSGQVEGAFYRPEIGDIDVVWGKVTDKEKHKGYGLAHIIDKHGMDAVNKIGEVVKNGEIITSENTERLKLEKDGYLVGIRQQFNGKKKIWIVTGFKKDGAVKTTRPNKHYTEGTLPETATNSITQNKSEVNGKTRSEAMMGNQNAKKNISSIENVYPEKNYPEYKGKGQEAVDFIVKQKSGQVEGAFYRPEIGDIDVVWGKVTDKEKHKGYGLAHIIDKHGMDAVNKIGGAINEGDVKIQQNDIATIYFETFKVGLSKGWKGKGTNHWIVTAYKDERGNNKTFDSTTNSTGEALPETPTSSITQNTEKSSTGIKKIKKHYNSFPQKAGDEDEIYVGSNTLKGTWKLIEADAPSASHNEVTFNKTDGFPTNKDGSTINDRDYENDKAAQLAVINIAGNYDGRALSFDTPVIVTKDGVVISGNNRTMSSKLAAKKGTDTAYIEALKKRAKKFGFSENDVKQFKNPRVVFEIDNQGQYSTEEFAQFNVSETKTMNPIEQAVKVSKIIKTDTVKSIATTIANFDTMSELYANEKSINSVFDVLEQSGIINQFTRPQYVNDGSITGAGKEFLETVLIGSVVNENNIRGLNREGCKNIRRKLVRAIAPLINNKGMGGYSITNELNEAINIVMQVSINKEKFGSVEEFAKQADFFEEKNNIAIELAKKLEGKEKEFADFMQKMNAALEPSANGQADIFFGEIESKDEVLNRMFNLKKSISTVVSNVLNGLSSFFSNKEQKIIQKSINKDLTENENPELTIAINLNSILPDNDSATENKIFDNVVTMVNNLIDKGHKIIIYSSFAKTQEAKETIYRFLVQNSIEASCLEIADEKPLANMYIENEDVKFRGEWKETLQNIETYKSYILKAFNETEHPRGNNGRFTSKGGGYVKSQRQKLKKNLKEYLDKDIMNENTGILAYISGGSINKISSDAAIEKTKNNNFSIDDHFQACNEIISLFKKATLTETRKDKYNSPDIISIKRFNSDLLLNSGKKANAYITVKEIKIHGHKIYSIELLEIKKAQGITLSLEVGDASHTPSHNYIISQNNNLSSAKIPIREATDDENLNSINTQKSLTYSGYPLQGRTTIHGMNISIENKKGSIREGVDKDGHKWSIKMKYDYGYIRGTIGKDKDHIDVYLGNNPESKTVFVIHQNDPVTGKYDEDKVMLGFNTAKKAKKAYLSQYDRSGFFGSMDVMSINEFKKKAFNTHNKGKKIA